MTDAVVILSTAPVSQAKAIAQVLVEKRLAACVNIMDVRSVYRWEGKICDEPEQMLVIKTLRERQEAVITAIRELHGYELPEMIVLPVTGGYAPYLAWIGQETGST
jgi:periplasmic divalent cation tolerance protein